MTDKKIKELWGLCGFKRVDYQIRVYDSAPDTSRLVTVYHRWKYLDGEGDTFLPELTLDNYWKYVIPTLQKEYQDWRSLLHDWVDSLDGSHEKDVVLLFAQTYGIIKEKRKE